MKKLLFTCAVLLICLFVHAQNATEAKMAYQMAEEKFVAKHYDEALDFLKKAETALGKTNPPMAYLRVLIADQIAHANEKTDKAKEALDNLENAFATFDKMPGKEALGEEKLMEVYRIKTDLPKRKEAYTTWMHELETAKAVFVDMVYRLAGEYPKTHVSVAEFLQHPMAWNAPLASYKKKLKERHVQSFVKFGGALTLTRGSAFSYSDLTPGQFYMESFKTAGENIDNVRTYEVRQFVRKGPRKSSKELVTKQQIVELLKIPKELWDGVTWGMNTKIISSDKYYRISYTSEERLSNNEFKKFILTVYRAMDNIGNRDTYQSISVRIDMNTL